MDNKVFNVNGSGEDQLLKTLELAFGGQTCSGWQETEDHGMILCWTADSVGINPMPGDLTAEQCLPFITAWLESDFASKVKFGEMCGPYKSSDVDNGKGWQVYVEQWGHVGNQHYSICAVRPAYMWYGK
ncbi:hypothetical protein HBA55_29420 [Pseudomaricurvus alkylphenolicus]|uniref:hypothetical protein n=1 Tax=Pseudomaricurvus alkylphenolicus TaxID=1306991 RepID=UPI0014200A5D|nr:hypothetical protein [Pseudomaricurvus alkylphenolicus]NIB43759.1 hypothetical protein [Pseudomaricurvus alkylphenolicus]